MSIQITSGLAVVVGATIASIAKNTGSFELRDLEKIRLPIIIIFGLYVLIQFLLLTNYIYHTVTVHGGSFVYKKVIGRSFERIFEIDGLTNDKKPIKTSDQWLVNKLQPLVIYFSTAAGLVLVSYVLFTQPPILSLCCLRCVVAIVVILWGFLFVLIYLHKRAPAIGIEPVYEWVFPDSSQQLPSKDAKS